MSDLYNFLFPDLGNAMSYVPDISAGIDPAALNDFSLYQSIFPDLYQPFVQGTVFHITSTNDSRMYVVVGPGSDIASGAHRR